MAFPSPLCWLTIRPGTASSTSPGRMMGRASSWAAVMAPTLAAVAMPTRFSRGFSRSAMLRNVRVPVTTTSAVSDSVNVASTASVSPAAGTVTSCRAVEKFTSRNVSVAGPACAPSMRYAPAASLTAVSTESPASRSTITPGSTPPVSSATTPATAPPPWARAAPARPVTITSEQTNTDTKWRRSGIRPMYRPPDPRNLNVCIRVSEDFLKRPPGRPRHGR